MEGRRLGRFRFVSPLQTAMATTATSIRYLSYAWSGRFHSPAYFAARPDGVLEALRVRLDGARGLSRKYRRAEKRYEHGDQIEVRLVPWPPGASSRRMSRGDGRSVSPPPTAPSAPRRTSFWVDQIDDQQRVLVETSIILSRSIRSVRVPPPDAGTPLGTRARPAPAPVNEAKAAAFRSARCASMSSPKADVVDPFTALLDEPRDGSVGAVGRAARGRIAAERNAVTRLVLAVSTCRWSRPRAS